MPPATFPVTVYACGCCGTYSLRKFNIARHVRQSRECCDRGAEVEEIEATVHCPSHEPALSPVDRVCSLSEDDAVRMVRAVTSDKRLLNSILVGDHPGEHVDVCDVLWRLFRYTKGVRGATRYATMFQHGNDIFQVASDGMRRGTKGEVIQELVPFLLDVMAHVVTRMTDVPLPKKARNQLIVFEHDYMTAEVDRGMTLRQILSLPHGDYQAAAFSKSVTKTVRALKKNLRYELDTLPHLSAARIEALSSLSSLKSESDLR